MRLVWAGQLELELGISFTPKKSQLRVDMQGQGTWDKGHDLYTIPYISKPSTLNYELTYLLIQLSVAQNESSRCINQSMSMQRVIGDCQSDN